MKNKQICCKTIFKTIAIKKGYVFKTEQNSKYNENMTNCLFNYNISVFTYNGFALVYYSAYSKRNYVAKTSKYYKN